MYLTLVLVHLYNVLLAYSQETFPSSRRTHGSPAARNQFPYHAGVILKRSNNITSGALVSNVHIITVADFNPNEEDIKVLLGATLYREENEEGTRVFDLTFKDSVTIHDGYKSHPELYNFAFITLPIAIEFNAYISPINLPIWEDRDNPFDEKPVTISGWNIKAGKRRPSRSLHFASGQIASKKQCQHRRDVKVTLHHLCLDTRSGRIPCNIDPGAPIVYEESGLRMVIGLAAGQGHCSTTRAHVATKFISHLRWFQRFLPILFDY